MSAAAPMGAPLICSGDMYASVPRKPPGLRLPEVDQVSHAEVAQLGVTGGVEEDVRRLDVAVDDAALVRRAQRRPAGPAPGAGPRRATGGPSAASRSPACRRTSARDTNSPAPAVRRAAPRCWGGGAGRRPPPRARSARRPALRIGGRAAQLQYLERDLHAQQRVGGLVHASGRARAEQPADVNRRASGAGPPPAGAAWPLVSPSAAAASASSSAASSSGATGSAGSSGASRATTSGAAPRKPSASSSATRARAARRSAAPACAPRPADGAPRPRAAAQARRAGGRAPGAPRPPRRLLRLRDQAFVDEPGLAQIAGAPCARAWSRSRWRGGRTPRRAAVAARSASARPRRKRRVAANASARRQSPAVGGAAAISAARAVGSRPAPGAPPAADRPPPGPAARRRRTATSVRRAGSRAAAHRARRRGAPPRRSAPRGDERRPPTRLRPSTAHQWKWYDRHAPMGNRIIGVIGGSGLYDIDGLATCERRSRRRRRSARRRTPVVRGAVGDTPARLPAAPRRAATGCRRPRSTTAPTSAR